MSERYIVYGNKGFGFAEITSEGSTFGTPTFIEGMISSNINSETTVSNIYADDVIYATVPGNTSRSAEVSLRHIPTEYAKYLGYVKQPNGMIIDNGQHDAHCIFFVETVMDTVTNKLTEQLTYLYNVTATEGEVSTSTIEDEVEAKELMINYTAKNSSIAVDSSGVQCGYGRIIRTEENAALFDQYKTKVLLPKDTVEM